MFWSGSLQSMFLSRRRRTFLKLSPADPPLFPLSYYDPEFIISYILYVDVEERECTTYTGNSTVVCLLQNVVSCEKGCKSEFHCFLKGSISTKLPITVCALKKAEKYRIKTEFLSVCSGDFPPWQQNQQCGSQRLLSRHVRCQEEPVHGHQSVCQPCQVLGHPAGYLPLRDRTEGRSARKLQKEVESENQEFRENRKWRAAPCYSIRKKLEIILIDQQKTKDETVHLSV